MSKVSIIVPCYNQSEYLPEALDSVLAQSYSNWECIIVNDGSPDATEKTALSYCGIDNRFIYVSKKNGGLASARNFGINKASGEYILPLDADDKISQQYIEKAVEVLDTINSVKVVAAKVQLFGTSTEIWERSPYNFRSLLIENSLYCTCLYRHKDYINTNGYDETMVDGFEDWDFWISMLKDGGDVHELPFIGFYYRKKEKSMFVDLLKDRKKVFYALLKLYNNQAASYEKYFDTPIYLISENLKLARLLKNFQASKTYKIGVRLKKMLRLFKGKR